MGPKRGSVGRYDPWGIKATGFAVTTKINHYAAVTLIVQLASTSLDVAPAARWMHSPTHGNGGQRSSVASHAVAIRHL